MPVAKLYQHGLTVGTPPRRVNRKPLKRRKVAGWSAGACRRNTAFLRSVLEHELPGVGLTFTLTLQKCPPDSDAWHRMRRAYIRRLERAGIHCLHWVTEWQRRGVPHLHGIAYVPVDEQGHPVRSVCRATASWIEIAEAYGAREAGQHFAIVHDVVGWLQYLGKHASRGVSHYQRNPAHVPKAWQGKTGRVWGHVGDWPIREPIALEVDSRGTWALRRMVRRWRIADARATKDPQLRARRIRSARRMLSCNERGRSSVRGLSEWIPPNITDLMLQALHRDGHGIRDYVKPVYCSSGRLKPSLPNNRG